MSSFFLEMQLWEDEILQERSCGKDEMLEERRKALTKKLRESELDERKLYQ